MRPCWTRAGPKPDVIGVQAQSAVMQWPTKECQPGNASSHQEPEEKDGFFPRAFRSHVALLTPCSQASGLQNRGKINF